MNKINPVIIFLFFSLILNSCAVLKMGGDAKENPPEPQKRVQKNLEEGKGFRLNTFGQNIGKGGTFEFASSNELWRASLDTIDFIPLASVNYSGGIIITDWYSNDTNSNELIKISIRFLTNEIRSDALDVNVFYRECSESLSNCKVNQKNNELASQITLSILKKASQYETERIDKYKKENPYEVSTPTKERDLPKNQ